MDMQKKDLSVKTEAGNERTVIFTISKEVVDRDGDILRASGVDFTNYMKNPVFLSFHNSHEFPLGKVLRFWVENDSVKAEVYFPTIAELSSDLENVSEKAKLVDFTYHCYKTGMLNAVSVGFIPTEYKETRTGLDVIKWELLEFSAVAVPANQDAIAEAVKSFGNDFAKSFVTKKALTLDDIIEKVSECEKACDEVRKMIAEFEKSNDKKEIVLEDIIAKVDVLAGL